MNPFLQSSRTFLNQLTRMYHINMNGDDVLDDLSEMVRVFRDDPMKFQIALARTAHQLEVLSSRDPGRALKHPPLIGWKRVAFESKPQSGKNADLRIVYRKKLTTTDILGFGHRRKPVSIYDRLNIRANQWQSNA